MRNDSLFPWSDRTLLAGALNPLIIDTITRALDDIRRIDPAEVGAAFAATHLRPDPSIYLGPRYRDEGAALEACGCALGALYAVRHGLSYDDVLRYDESGASVRNWSARITGSELYRDAIDAGFRRIAGRWALLDSCHRSEVAIRAIYGAGILDGALARDAAEAAYDAAITTPVLFRPDEEA